MSEAKARRHAGLIVSVVLACATLGSRPLSAQSDRESSFYKGKIVKLIVGFASGGGYDAYARMIAPYVARALQANVVVENQPGAGGIAALDNIAVAQPDGLQVMLVDGMGAAVDQLVGLPGVRYDLSKFSYVGTASTSKWVWLVAPNSQIVTPRDAVAAHKKMTWSASGQIDGGSIGAEFTCEALALACNVIVGYPGSNEAALAVARGEIDSIYVSDSSGANYQKAWNARPVTTMGRQRSRYFPQTPTVYESTNPNPSGRWLFDYYATLQELGRIILAPPGIPPGRLAILQAAVKNSLTDPALISEGERTARFVDFLDASATRRTAQSIVSSISPEERERVKAILTKPH